jgi:hypothetical protein
VVRGRESGCSEAKDLCTREEPKEQNGNFVCPSLCLLMSAFPALLNRHTVQQLLLVNSSSYDQGFTRPCVRKHRLCRHELQMASQKGRRLALLQKLVQPLC